MHKLCHEALHWERWSTCGVKSWCLLDWLHIYLAGPKAKFGLSSWRYSNTKFKWWNWTYSELFMGMSKELILESVAVALQVTAVASSCKSLYQSSHVMGLNRHGWNAASPQMLFWFSYVPAKALSLSPEIDSHCFHLWWDCLDGSLVKIHSSRMSCAF